MGVFKRIGLLMLPALIAGAVPVQAQGVAVANPPKFFGNFSSVVGGWSEYSVTETETGKKSTMRNAVVGKEGESFWYEVAINEGGARNIIKMFLKGDPNNAENIQRLIMKNGDQPAQEMPREFVVMGRRMATAMFETRSGSAVTNQPNIKTEEAGSQSVTVPAGSFSVTHYRVLDGTGKVLAEFDFSKDVLPMGIVRSTTDKVKLELVGTGKDAVSSITEEPTMMKAPPGMPGANPRGKPPGMPVPGNTAPASGGYGSPVPAAPAAGGYGK